MNESSIILYQSEDGITKIETRLYDETVWLTQMQIAELFQKGRSTITEHLKNVFDEGELDENVVCRKFRLTTSHGAIEGKTQEKEVKHYNLDVIISVGYRVKSHQGTKFRQWATTRLKEYIVKGFTMNDELLKQAGGGNYFDELLARIRDIRSSEKVFWRKVLDIYATSIDYDPRQEMSQSFFQTIQNKMHWAAHRNTAAETIYNRIDASKPNLGLTTFKGNKPTKQEIEVAKNYLTENELNILNRIVSAYLELAELQALNRKPMYMKDWMERLDDFLKMTGNEILQNTGEISHKQAIEKAQIEYEKYKEIIVNEISSVEQHFIEQIETSSKKIETKKRGK
ncbi:virulence RhuM family protein [Flavobacterium sp. SUN046]|uniref:virulence RhuM family protein n=1 Tax=Flavobacterium sp. SUN046 TaxID=3002440 RepID=UPI002DBC9A61|nr:virulence RhuM family protein [Flavobacterium sp. SUN046]MEC4050059.1 virulence RhuM family protein [Flavobacterium sp. SUN046]